MLGFGVGFVLSCLSLSFLSYLSLRILLFLCLIRLSAIMSKRLINKPLPEVKIGSHNLARQCPARQVARKTFSFWKVAVHYTNIVLPLLMLLSVYTMPSMQPLQSKVQPLWKRCCLWKSCCHITRQFPIDFFQLWCTERARKRDNGHQTNNISDLWPADRFSKE